jgi:uncharacterized protein YrrD
MGKKDEGAVADLQTGQKVMRGEQAVVVEKGDAEVRAEQETQAPAEPKPE